MTPGRVAVLVCCAAAALAVACGSGGPGQVEARGSWERLPDAPLSPREFALGVWTGRHVLILGGSDAPPTHPSASGPAKPRPLLRDGALFDPRGRSWRRIAAAPLGIAATSPAAVAGGSVYVAVPRRPGVRHTRVDLLAYRLGAGRWERLPAPPRRDYVVVAAGDRLVAAGPRRGPVPLSVFALGRGDRRWTRLPPPPLRGSLVWDGQRLVLIGYDPAARDADHPPLARAATLRLGDRAWRRLPDSDRVLWGHGFWVPVGGRLVSPELGTGGVAYSFGRPFGGILDPRRGVWSELPNVPEPHPGGGTDFGTGVLTRTRLVGGLPGQLVLDMQSGDWLRVPRVWGDRVMRQGWTTENTRRGLVLFGGARWRRSHPDGELLNDAWLWTPPRG